MDEWKGRTIAQRRGLPLTGALGILGIAYQKQILGDPMRILAMMRTQGSKRVKKGPDDLNCPHQSLSHGNRRPKTMILISAGFQ